MFFVRWESERKKVSSVVPLTVVNVVVVVAVVVGGTVVTYAGQHTALSRGLGKKKLLFLRGPTDEI